MAVAQEESIYPDDKSQLKNTASFADKVKVEEIAH